jgi:hypothetical protein
MHASKGARYPGAYTYASRAARGCLGSVVNRQVPCLYKPTVAVENEKRYAKNFGNPANAINRNHLPCSS